MLQQYFIKPLLKNTKSKGACLRERGNIFLKHVIVAEGIAKDKAKKKERFFYSLFCNRSCKKTR